jgi:SulP family sulfate permease
MPNGAATAHLLQPKLVSVVREGYSVEMLRRDIAAGLTVAIVALPLSTAIAIASGVTPERGLYTAIVGGFIVSALSGSRFQIGGPAGAFIVLMASAVAQFGVPGMLTAVLMSGVMLALLGLLRIGSFVQLIPPAVITGFTAGIAATIAASQIRDFTGLILPAPEPVEFFPKLAVLAANTSHANFWALGLGLVTAATIVTIKAVRPGWPAMLIAVALAALMASGAHLPVGTIASRFGGIPHSLPAPVLPSVSPDTLIKLLPTALSFTLLGAIESLLSAKVADGMTGRVHRSNMELVGQGVANVGSALFGGIAVTGTIARTATNIRAGARTPVAGMLHAIFLLLFMLIAAPLAGYIPLSALAAVLLVVCWSMVEKKEIAHLLKSWPTAIVLLVTLGATLLKDLTWGIVLGCCAAALLRVLSRRAN